MRVHDFLLHTEADFGDKVAIVHGKTRIKYSSLLGYSRHITAWLVGRNLAVGDRVAILTDDPTHYIASYFGILEAGGIVVGLNTQTSERSLDTVFSDCEPSYVFVSGRNRKYSKYIGAHSCVKEVLNIGFLLDPSSSSDTPEVNDRPKIRPEDIAQIIYTS